MLEVIDAVKVFNSGGTMIHAVNNLSFSVPHGSFAAVIGKSGSGKSTLLSLLAALDKPSSGVIIVGDQDITKMSDRQLIKYRWDQIGFVFQSFNLVPNLPALENVMLPMEYAGVSATEQKTRAAQLLNQVGLPDDKQLRKPTRLSGGEQQRVAIARALANKPTLSLADEPTGNLDSQTGRMIIDLLHNLVRSEQAIIIAVTHDLGLAKEADITFHLKDGTLTKEIATKTSNSVKG